jgi:hypothetical protein
MKIHLRAQFMLGEMFFSASAGVVKEIECVADT